MKDHFHHWHFEGPNGKAYDRLVRSPEAWNTKQACHLALQRDYGLPFGKAGVVMKCVDEECATFREDHQDQLIQSVTGGWIRQSEV